MDQQGLPRKSGALQAGFEGRHDHRWPALLFAFWLLAAGGLLAATKPVLAQHPVAIESMAGHGLRAGASARNIDPISFPVWVSGGIVAGKADHVVDSLYARSLVLESDGDAIAICVVDSLAVPASLVDRAKEIVASSVGIPPERILISATHSHSAPCVMGAHGTPVQEDYAELLPVWIAESIVQAHQRLEPAVVGTTVTNAEKFIHCRRWVMEPGHASSVRFSGRDGDIVAMNPGHDNPFKLYQTAQVDRTIPILSVQTLAGEPMAVLASFCTHYAGAPALSSDYFGVVAQELAHALRPDAPHAFVGIMANATSGDANCIDFSRPAKPFHYREVGKYVAQRILDAMPRIHYQGEAAIDGKLERISVAIRKPSEEEAQEAEAYVAARMGDRLPSNLEENYARETVLLAGMPATRLLPLQALRVGDLAIAAIPNETFNATGLAVRSRSPLAITMNIGLANDYAGYLPPADQFPLGGYTTWRARTSCLAVDAEAKVVEMLGHLLQSIASERISKAKDPTPRGVRSVVEHPHGDSAVTPEESLSHFAVASGQRVTVAAHEPHCIDPVAIRFDDSGDLWVVEMGDYPMPREASATPRGRIRVLRDQDLDGVFETGRTFAEGLRFPTGLQFHKDGVLVTTEGQLLWLRDTDGDGLADQTREWIQGFAEENSQLRANDPDFGIDNHLYIANGLRSAKIQSRLDSSLGSDASSFEIANSDVRMNPLSGTMERIAGPSQFGMTWDRYGNRYFCSNRNPCDQVLIEPAEVGRSPLAGLGIMTSSVLPVAEHSRVYPLVSAWTTSNLHAGQFTAACGLLLSDSEQLPAASLANALVCEPTGSLVHRVGLGRVHGQTLVEEPERGEEWLASRDPWFRPVNLEEGPEGAIYVVDMHRAVIEHPDWVPEELKQREDERWGDDCGRIYRVTKLDAPACDPLFAELRERPLRQRTERELVDLLDHRREWVRKTAARLLNERDSAELATLLIEFIESRPKSSGLLRAVYGLVARSQWTSDRLHALLDPTASASHSVTDPALRAALWKTASSISDWSEALLSDAVWAIASGNRDETLAAANALAGHAGCATYATSDQVFRACMERSTECADDPYALMALSAVVRFRMGEFTDRWMQRAWDRIESKQWCTGPVGSALSRWVSLSADPSQPQWVATRQAWFDRAHGMASSTGTTVEADRRVIEEPKLRLLLSVASGITQSKDREWLAVQEWYWNWLATLAAESSYLRSVREDAIQLLGSAMTSELSQRCAKTLASLARQETDPGFQGRILAAWAKHPDPDLEGWILDRLEASGPGLRGEMFLAMITRPERVVRLITALERGTLTAASLDAVQIQRLGQIASGEAKERFDRWMANRIQSDRQQVIDRYASALSGKPDLIRGKALFQQHCSACHRVDGVGIALGPDISDSRTQSPMQLLVAILDPNRAVDNNYFRTMVRMEDGTVHDGIAVEESAQHLTLRSPTAGLLVLAKSEIESMKGTGVSLMPEGIEAQIDDGAMADLVGYLKNWRYAGGEAPKIRIDSANLR